MKQLNYDETKRLLKFWEENCHEDVLLFEITEGYSYIFKAYANYNEDNGNISVLAYHDGAGWELSKLDVEHLMEASILSVIHEMQDNHCGDINFYYETEADREYFETAYDCMWQFATSTKDAPIVLDMEVADFSQLFDLLKPGCYLIHFSDTLGNQGGVVSC